MTKQPLFPSRHLLGIKDLKKTDILGILDAADDFLKISETPVKRIANLQGKTVINFFMEESTRTRSSFEIAGKRLGADVINVSASGSSLAKGETILDTALNLDAMKADLLVVRHPTAGSVHMLAQHVRAGIVNAGDGMNEHPTQALLDCATIRKHKRSFENRIVTIIGDVAHSRVARSNIYALNQLGAKVRVAGPLTLLPLGLETLGVKSFCRVEEAIEGADVLMVLRLQKERQESGLIPNAREYSRYFGLNSNRLKLARPDAIVMHPGPMNRGIEIENDVADGPQSVILEQVTYGVAIRMAILDTLIRNSDRTADFRNG